MILAAAAAIRRHSFTQGSVQALNQLRNQQAPKKAPSITGATRRPPSTTTTTTKRVMNPDRTMSLTTTTIRNLGSFELVTTKTTPIRAPARSNHRKQQSSSASVLSYESDLDSVLEEDAGFKRFPRNHQNKIAFSPVLSIDEGNERPPSYRRHNPPARTLSPGKSSLKDHSRTTSLASMSDDSSTLIQPSSAGARNRNSRVSFSGRSPNGNVKLVALADHDTDSDSGNSVYSDASEYLPMPSIMNVVAPKPKHSTSAAAAAAKKYSQPAPASQPNVAAAAAARSSAQQHERRNSLPVQRGNKLTEAAVQKHNANTGKRSGYGTAEYTRRQYEEQDDYSDVISMNSTSSWQRPNRAARPRMLSMRESNSSVTSINIREQQQQQRHEFKKLQQHRRPSQAPPPKKSTKDYSQYVLKRTPSTSSFEKARKSGGGNTGFSLKTLRAPPAPAPVAPSPDAGVFKSRFADSDSEPEDVPIGSPTRVEAIESPPASPSHHQPNMVQRISSSWRRPRAFSQSSVTSGGALAITGSLSNGGSSHPYAEIANAGPSDLPQSPPQSPTQPMHQQQQQQQPKPKRRLGFFSRSKKGASHDKTVEPELPVNTGSGFANSPLTVSTGGFGSLGIDTMTAGAENSGVNGGVKHDTAHQLANGSVATHANGPTVSAPTTTTTSPPIITTNLSGSTTLEATSSDLSQGVSSTAPATSVTTTTTTKTVLREGRTLDPRLSVSGHETEVKGQDLPLQKQEQVLPAGVVSTPTSVPQPQLHQQQQAQQKQQEQPIIEKKKKKKKFIGLRRVFGLE